MAGHTEGATGRSSGLADTLERFRGWLLAGLIIGGVALLWLGFHIDWLSHWEARVLAFLLPALPAAIAIVLLRPLPPTLRATGVAIALVAASIAEVAIAQAMLPPTPYSSTRLDVDHPAAGVKVPPDAATFLVSVHGAFDRSGEARWSYHLDLSRGKTTSRIAGELSQTLRRNRRSRFTGPSSTLVVHETDTHEVSLPGQAELRAVLTDTTGDQPAGLKITVARPPWGQHSWPFALAAGVVLAAIVDGAAARRSRTLQLSTGLGAIAVFGVVLSSYFNPDAELRSVMGACLLAALGGSLGGWLLGAIARALGRSATQPASTAAP